MKNTMKLLKIKTFLAILTLGSFVILSCSEDDDTSSVALAEEEVEVVIESSLVDAGGIIGDINSISASLAATSGRSTNGFVAKKNDLTAISCNQMVSQSFQNSNTVGNRSWTVESNWSWILNCDVENNRVSYDLNGNGILDFDGPNLSKEITRTHDFNITGIEPSSTQWVYNANHTRDGLIQSKVGNENSMSTVLEYGSTDIVVSKATEQIVSGSFTLDFTATLFNGNIVTRGGTVVFNGNQTATVTLNNGTTFEVSWVN